MSEAKPPKTRWSEVASVSAEDYQRRFDALAARGVSVHGEADLVAALAPAGGRILDAGCGTGRVSAELTRRGFTVMGVDADADMIEVARRRDGATMYAVHDLSELDLAGDVFDVIVMAGNVIPLLAPGTLAQTAERIAGHVVTGGLVIAGFGLDEAHLPGGCPVTTLDDYDAACLREGLKTVARYGTWDREPWSPHTGYVVAIHELRRRR